MFDEARSRRIQNAALVVVVLGIFPLAFFALRGFYYSLTRPRFLTPTPVVSVTPKIRTELKRVGSKLEVTILIQDPSTVPLTKVELNSLKVDAEDVLGGKILLGPLAAGTSMTKRYTIPFPAKLRNPASVQYRVEYEQGSSSGGGSTGFDTVYIK